MKELKKNNAVITSHEYNLKHQLKFSIDLDKSKHLIEKLNELSIIEL